jgi:hypothetical protein
MSIPPAKEIVRGPDGLADFIFRIKSRRRRLLVTAFEYIL